MFNQLKTIALTHKKRLAGTFSLVAMENLLFMFYPMVAGFAVNAVIEGNLVSALVYVGMVLIIWAVGSLRRAVDTRAFTRIYAEIAVPIVVKQRHSQSTSATTARVALSRKFVDFFEDQLPTLITSVFSIVGSTVMLLWIEFWSGVVAVGILILFSFLMPNYIKVNDRLYEKLNNRLEKEVDLIERTKHSELVKHYDLLSKLRVLISNREALSYLCIGVACAILFGTTLTILTLNGYGSSGHIYAVITYLWTFAISLDDIPRLVEQFSELRDISQRVVVENDNEESEES